MEAFFGLLAMEAFFENTDGERVYMILGCEIGRTLFDRLKVNFCSVVC